MDNVFPSLRLMSNYFLMVSHVCDCILKQQKVLGTYIMITIIFIYYVYSFCYRVCIFFLKKKKKKGIQLNAWLHAFK